MKLTILKFGVLAIGLLVSSHISAQEKKKPDPKKMFASFDANQDKAISLEEFKGRKRKNEIAPEVLEKRFAKMDGDSNGSVTIEEFIANMQGGKGEKKKKQE